MSRDSTQPQAFFRLTTNDQLHELGLNHDDVKDLYDYLISVLRDDDLVSDEPYLSNLFTAFVKTDLYMREKNVKSLLGYPALLTVIEKDNDGVLFCENNKTAFTIALALALDFADGVQFSALKIPGSGDSARQTLIKLVTQLFDTVMSWLGQEQDYFDDYVDTNTHPKNMDTMVKLLTLSQICHPGFNEYLKGKISAALSSAPLPSDYTHPEMLDCLKTLHIISGAVDSQGCPDYENLPGAEEDFLDAMYNIALALAEVDDRSKLINDVMAVILFNVSFNYLESGVPAHKVIALLRTSAHLINPWYSETVGEDPDSDFLDVIIASAFSAHPEYWPAIKKEPLLGLPLAKLKKREPYDIAYGPLKRLEDNEAAQRNFLKQLATSGVDYLDEDTTCRLAMLVDYVSNSMAVDNYLVALRTQEIMNHKGWKKLPRFLLINPAHADCLDASTLSKVVEQCVIDVNNQQNGYLRRLPLLVHALSYSTEKSQPLLECVCSQLEPDFYLKKIMDSLPTKAYQAFSLPDRLLTLRLEGDLGL